MPLYLILLAVPALMLARRPKPRSFRIKKQEEVLGPFHYREFPARICLVGASACQVEDAWREKNPDVTLETLNRNETRDAENLECARRALLN